MSIKIVGSFAYRTNEDNEIKNIENNQIKQTKNFEKISTPQYKEDSTEYLSEFNLVTDEGYFKWNVITSVDMDGSRINDYELVDYPSHLEIIDNIEFMIEDKD